MPKKKQVKVKKAAKTRGNRQRTSKTGNQVSERQAAAKKRFNCKFSIFLRICDRKKRDAIDVIKEAGIYRGHAQKYFDRISQGKAVELWTFWRLATVLNVEADNLYYAYDPRSPHFEGNVYKFARRVAELIEDERGIPHFDRNTGDPIDVPTYVWQMGDPILDGIPITFQEQREAYFLLRDHFLAVFECPTSVAGISQPLIGRMEVGKTPIEDIESDLDARRAASGQCYATLQSQWGTNRVHIERIRDDIGRRMEIYNAAAKADRKVWNKYRGGPIDRASVLRVIDADHYLRTIIFPTDQQDSAFTQFYSRSRRMIEREMDLFPNDFAKWWPDFRKGNTEALKKFTSAWLADDRVSEPCWEVMAEALKENLRETRKLIRITYAKTPRLKLRAVEDLVG